MLNKFCGIASIAAVGVGGQALAAPAIWETNYGSELTDLTGSDDVAEMVTISFDFEYAGVVYNDMYVGTNGGVGLGGVGEADDYPSGDEFLFTSSPILAPFWSDLDLSRHGNVYFNDFGDRAVFTWDGVGTYEDDRSSNTFQLQIYSNGKIVFGYNGIEHNTSSYFDTDIHIGMTEGGLVNWPAEVDYTAAPFAAGPTVLELFGYDDDDLDLDYTNIIFRPDGNGGYTISVPAPGTAGLFVLGAVAMRRRR